MSRRFRPFGVVGSMLEVLAGLLVLRSVLWTDEEEYPGWFATVVVVIGGLLICVGVIGLAVAVRHALIARSQHEPDVGA